MVDYRYLGRSGLKVSPLTLGTMMFGGETDEATSHRIIDSARESGINFIDTADVYNNGRSEEVVGSGIRAHRDHWVLATKFANGRGAGPNTRGQSRKWIIETVENSLRRLNTDYIDILYFHRAIFDAPLGEGVRAIGDLIRQGKLRYFGVSNFRAWRIAEVSHLADQLNIDRPIASQPLYNIFNRVAEAEQLPAADHYGLGVVSYSPLARGVLTGKYRADQAPTADTRAGRADKRILETEWRPESIALASKIADYARNKGIDPVHFAIAWVLNNRLVTSTITGPRTQAHWDSYIGALDVKLTAADEAFIDSLVTTGHASTHGFNDPSHPIEGRVPRVALA
jgi:aryl-alcohol dehydrogenase-like predicted oxidoreductase